MEYPSNNNVDNSTNIDVIYPDDDNLNLSYAKPIVIGRRNLYTLVKHAIHCAEELSS